MCNVIAAGRRLGVLVCTAMALGLLATSAQATSISSNWAGYVGFPSHGRSFESISASWIEPRASCGGRETFSAVWVGLGGYHEEASDLEQIGTDADCAGTKVAYYSAWFELLPAVPVTLPLRIRPGDAITAAVTVHHHDVTFGLRDLTTGARVSHTRRDSALDLSSADWIVEAPSTCGDTGGCTTLSLTDFGDVSFTSATATSAGHTGPISDPRWHSSALELRQSDIHSTRGHAGPHEQPEGSSVTATPSAISTGGAFSVDWAELSQVIEAPPTPAGTAAAMAASIAVA